MLISIVNPNDRPVVLDAKGIVKTFGQVKALNGVDLAVTRQELVFVIGPSGSGKSTLLRCCNRLEEPTAGAVVTRNVRPHALVLGNPARQSGWVSRTGE
ncbi:MAG TPA: ATP-binding cassette domain-containing protein, partial [Acidobacteria bacterium]|nr:ATP-binding cassette domain-containing protein [Acidobacteriota bacterium]